MIYILIYMLCGWVYSITYNWEDHDEPFWHKALAFNVMAVLWLPFALQLVWVVYIAPRIK
jgi:hypothetical protein